MHAVALAIGDQLGEYHRQPAVPGGVADVILARRPVRRVHHELLRRRVVGGGCAQVLDVRAVAGLGHREAARQVQAHDVAQVALVVALGAQRDDRAAEQSPLDTRLDHQRQVSGQHLQRDHRTAGVPAAAVGDREAEVGDTGFDQQVQLFKGLRAVAFGVEAVPRRELDAVEGVADLLPDVGPTPVQQGREFASVESGASHRGLHLSVSAAPSVVTG